MRLLLDEHVSRVFEQLFRERGYDSFQAKYYFRGYTPDEIQIHALDAVDVNVYTG